MLGCTKGRCNRHRKIEKTGERELLWSRIIIGFFLMFTRRHTHILVDGAFIVHGTGALSERIRKRRVRQICKRQSLMIRTSMEFSKPESIFIKAPKACRKKLSGLLAGLQKRATLDA